MNLRNVETKACLWDDCLPFIQTKFWNREKMAIFIFFAITRSAITNKAPLINHSIAFLYIPQKIHKTKSC